MKILLIGTLLHYTGNNRILIKTLNNLFAPPNLTLQHIAAITPKKHVVDVIDEMFVDVDFDINCDLVGISCIRTSSALHAYEIADEFRKRGKKVVLGGYHPSVLPEEAKQHADAIVIGEAECSWTKLLEDAEHEMLKPFYYQDEPVDLNNIQQADHKIGKKSLFTAAVQSSRGCPYGCEFCSITSQKFGHIYRKRPVEKVVDEIKSIPQKYIIFNEPSFSINMEYTKSLFREMKGLNKKFRCWMNANIPLEDEEFLALANDAGCIAVEIGFESLSQNTIDTISKKTNNVNLYKKIVRKIHDYGIAVGGTFALGFDTDTANVFDETLLNLPSLDLDFPRFSILTPYPGTPLFDRLDKEGRILTRDWSKYDMIHVVFQPKHMKPDELFLGWMKVCDEIYSPTSMIKRLFANNNLHLFSWFWRFNSNIAEKIK